MDAATSWKLVRKVFLDRNRLQDERGSKYITVIESIFISQKCTFASNDHIQMMHCWSCSQLAAAFQST